MTFLANLFKRQSTLHVSIGSPPPIAPTTTPISPAPNLKESHEGLLRRIRATDPSQFREMMLELNIPPDIADRVVALDITDEAKLSDLRLSCFGRLQYFQIVGLFVASLIHRKNGVTSSPTLSMEQLTIDGVLRATALLSKTQSEEVCDWLLTRPVYNGHVPEASVDKIGRYVGNTAEQFSFGAYSIADIVAAPHLIEAILNSEVLSQAEAHLGCVPTLANLQAWWNFSGHSENEVLVESGKSTTGYSPQNFHRDLNDFRMFWVYMYLTDVDDQCGPHQYLKKSGDFIEIERRLGARDNINVQDFFYQYGYQVPSSLMTQILGDMQETFKGTAGSTAYSNGFNFHRIKYPLTKRRLMFSARFSIKPAVYKGLSRDGDPIPSRFITSRIGTSPLVRYVTRNLIDWSERP